MAFLALLVANTRMHLRNRNSLFWHFMFPVLFMVLFGLLMGQGQASLNIGLVKGDSQWADHLETAFAEVEGVTLTSGNEGDLVQKLKDGDLSLVVVFRPAVGDTRQPVEVDLIYDPADDMAGGQVARAMMTGALDGIAKAAQDIPELFRVTESSVAAERLPYISFLMPGIIGMSVMFSCLFGTAGPLVTEREKGILRQIKLTPVRTPVFLAAKSAGMTVIAFLQAMIIIVIGMVAFDVEIHGSLWAAAIVLLLGSLMMVALGLVIAGIASRVESVDSIANAIAMPMLFLAGTFFPMDGAPLWLRTVGDALPLTYLNSGLRETLVGGGSVGDVWQALTVMAVWTVLFIGVASRLFRWDARKQNGK